MFSELAAEIIAVGKSCPVGNLPDGKFGVQEEHRGFFQAEDNQVFIRRIPCTVLEHPCQRALRNHDRMRHFGAGPTAFRMFRQTVDQFRKESGRLLLHRQSVFRAAAPEQNSQQDEMRRHRQRIMFPALRLLRFNVMHDLQDLFQLVRIQVQKIPAPQFRLKTEQRTDRGITAESLKPFVNPDAEGLAEAEAALAEVETRLAALAAKADEFLAKVDELLSKTNYADRKSALAAANALLADVDATYPGVEQAKLTLAEQEASLAANDAFVASFVAEVDDLKNGLRVSDRYKAYAKASQLAADAQLDLTNPAAAAAMEDFNAAVAAYSQLVENTNDAIADAIGATAGAAIASQEQKPASVVSSLAQVAAGE